MGSVCTLDLDGSIHFVIVAAGAVAASYLVWTNKNTTNKENMKKKQKQQLKTVHIESQFSSTNMNKFVNSLIEWSAYPMKPMKQNE